MFLLICKEELNLIRNIKRKKSENLIEELIECVIEINELRKSFENNCDNLKLQSFYRFFWTKKNLGKIVDLIK